MAAPVVQTTNTSATPAVVLNHPVALPSGVQPGDLLLVGVHHRFNGNFGGWTGWDVVTNVNAGAANRLEVRRRIADGSEGSTLTLTSSSTAFSAHNAYRITGHDPSNPVYVSTHATGATNAPNSPDLAPGLGALDWLWLSMIGCNADRTITTLPSSYTNQLYVQSSASAAGALCASARRALTAANEDPGAWLLSAAPALWWAITLGIRPASAGSTGNPWYHNAQQ